MSFQQKKQFSNRSDYWNTPSKLYEYIINDLGYIDYNKANTMITPFNKKTDMYHDDKIYINPPFSILRKEEFYLTIKELVDNNNVILLLIPSRTDTKYFHRILDSFDISIYFIKGRLKYNDFGSAPFPSLFMMIGVDEKSRLDKFFKGDANE